MAKSTIRTYIGGRTKAVWQTLRGLLQRVADTWGDPQKQLDDERLSVRLRGINTLERIARDSKKDHRAVMAVLSAFVREKSREQREADSAQVSSTAASGDDYTNQREESQAIRSDVQAAVAVIGRRKATWDDERLNLQGANLEGARLDGANLEEAVLIRANLEGALLYDANLEGAVLYDVNFKGAVLVNANLGGAVLVNANLKGAVLSGANLEKAVLNGANLEEAVLYDANLEGAVLNGAKLQNAEVAVHQLSSVRSITLNLLGDDLRAELEAHQT